MVCGGEVSTNHHQFLCLLLEFRGKGWAKDHHGGLPVVWHLPRTGRISSAQIMISELARPGM
jgi:hypothetical protein